MFTLEGEGRLHWRREQGSEALTFTLQVGGWLGAFQAFKHGALRHASGELRIATSLDKYHATRVTEAIYHALRLKPTHNTLIPRIHTQNLNQASPHLNHPPLTTL